MTHICVSKLTIIGSDNGLSPGRRQAIIWTNDGLLLIGHLGTHFSEISSEIHIFSFKKMHFKASSAKWRPSCLGLNELSFIIQSRLVLHANPHTWLQWIIHVYGYIKEQYKLIRDSVNRYFLAFRMIPILIIQIWNKRRQFVGTYTHIYTAQKYAQWNTIQHYDEQYHIIRSKDDLVWIDSTITNFSDLKSMYSQPLHNIDV